MSDALDRLKRKNRPKVQPRSTRVSQGIQDIQTNRHIDVKTQEPEATEAKDVRSSQSVDIQMSRHIDSQISKTSLNQLNELDDIEVKRSTFRLEVGLIGRLHRLCQDQGISREVMIESMFEYMEQNPEALEQVLKESEVKNARRQQIANKKRARAMIEKFG